MKRIHKPADPTADDAARHSGIMNHLGFLCLFAAISGSNRQKKHRLGIFSVKGSFGEP
jgi:hypothetical protein